jgi:nitrate/TMAO reductase-like tetraheme cytochrome c subunit
MKTVLGNILTFLKKLRFYEVLLIIFITVVLGAWSIKEITESAVFCGSTCHIMRPYYEDWKSSSHSSIPCVECHIAPSEKQQFVPEFKALGQVVSYLTRTYGDNRKAQVSDANCLKEGCHSHRLLDGRVTFATNIIFDHSPHLQSLRRGKILRCTTCHAQIAMGQHVTVVQDACFICHFKGNEVRPSTAECRLCHDPEQLSARESGEGFDHDLYVRRAVPCDSCHEGVISGNGELETASCGQCHDPYGVKTHDEPVELLHRVHVTDHNVECHLCHEPIRHKWPDQVRPDPADCRSCHSSKHAGILSMYQGTGARGVPPSPSPMYRARVSCRGCHRIPGPVQKGEREFRGDSMISSGVVCRSCHGSDFSGLERTWAREIADTLYRAETALARAEDHLGDPTRPDAIPGSGRSLEQARYNIHFVRASAPIHNRDYAVSILEKTILDLNRIMAIDR